jgi:hypothetical protein
MLERMQGVASRALALEASGTVMAGDVDAAVEAALGSKAATGLVVVISQDFDGYLAELARGLKSVSLAHKALVRIAVVAEAGELEEARLIGWSDAPVPIRFFAASDRRAAFDWADAAGRE